MGTVAFLRNYHIAKYLSRYFDNTHIITIKNISIPLKDKIPTDFGQIYSVFNYDYRNLGNLLSSKNNNLRNKTNAKSNSWKVKFIRKFIDSFPTNVIFGEGGILYIINATIRAIKIIKKNKITHIYSSYRPIADHIIAYNIKLLFPEINWIADFRDPPVNINLNNVYLTKLQNWFLKKLLKKANIVTAVSDGVNRSILSYNPKSFTVRNGYYSLFKFDNVDFNMFSMIYTGSLYPDLQKPAVFFKVLQQLLSKRNIEPSYFQLIYAGKDGSIWDKWIEEYDLQKISNNMGELSLSEAIKLQNKSHVNILLSWSGTEQKGVLTGKFYEYIAIGKPIFAFIRGEKDDEFESVFSELNAGFIYYDKDIEKIEKNILYFYNEWQKSGKIKHVFNKEKLKEYSWENRIIKLKKMILPD